MAQSPIPNDAVESFSRLSPPIAIGILAVVGIIAIGYAAKHLATLVAKLGTVLPKVFRGIGELKTPSRGRAAKTDRAKSTQKARSSDRMDDLEEVERSYSTRTLAREFWFVPAMAILCLIVLLSAGAPNVPLTTQRATVIALSSVGIALYMTLYIVIICTLPLVFYIGKAAGHAAGAVDNLAERLGVGVTTSVENDDRSNGGPTAEPEQATKQ